MRPPVGSMSRFTIFKVVVFPQPEGPTRTLISPSGTSRLRSVTAMVPSGKRLETESRRIMGRTPGRSAEGYPASVCAVTTASCLTEDLGEPSGGSGGRPRPPPAPHRAPPRPPRGPHDRVRPSGGHPRRARRGPPPPRAGGDLRRGARRGHHDRR